MRTDISLSFGGTTQVWEGEVDIKPTPRTEAAAASFTGAGLPLQAARAIQSQMLANGSSEAFTRLELLQASWVWSAREEDAILSIVGRNEHGEFRSYIGVVI